MIKKTFGFGLAGKTRGTLVLAIPVYLILTILVFGGGEAAALTWQPQGPGPIYGGDSVIVAPPTHPTYQNPVVGAVQSLLIDPTDNNNMYAGAVNGGIWKTTDGGVVWTPLTDTQKSLSMGGMAMDPGNPSRILAGFGEFSNANIDGPKAGLILSKDAGATWTPVGGAITANTDVSSIVITGVGGNIMFVASRSHAQAFGSPTPVTGLFRSTDGGASFIQISGSGGLPSGSVTSLASDPGNPNRLYAALQNSGIFRSDDQGKTWTKITPANSGIGASTQNIQLSVGANGASLFMGLSSGVTKATTLQSVWRSLDQGATWQNMGGQGSGPGRGLPGTIENGKFIGINNDGQGTINFALRADPNNPNIVYISGDDQPAWNQLTKSTKDWPNQIGATNHTGSVFRGDAGLALRSPPGTYPWNPTTPYPYNGQWRPVTDSFAANLTTPHADSRTLTFDALGNLLATDDGGIYRRSNPQSSTGQWTSLMGNLQVTEMHGISYDSNTHTLISGNQDTGASAQNKVSGTPVLIWTEQRGADGGQTAVNDQDHAFSVRYMSSQALGEFTHIKVDPDNFILEEGKPQLLVVRKDGSTVPLQDYEKANNSAIPTQAPVRVNQNDKTHLAIGTQRIYLGTDNANNGLSPDLRLTDISTFTFSSPVSDIAYGRPGNANILLAAEGHNLWLSTALTRGSLNPVNYPGQNTITSVFINPNFDNVFYVADGSCVRSNTGNKGDWVTGLSLPQLRSLQFMTNGLNAVVAGGYGTLYAARETDLDDWYSLKGNLPNTFVWKMDYSSRDDTLAVGTLGRGAFTVANASTLMPPTPSATDPVDTDWVRLLRSTSGDQILNGGTVQNPDSATLGINFTLNPPGGNFDTSGPNADAGTKSTLTGVISGPGSFTVVGNGILYLRGTNTYSGGTNLNGGTVNVLGPENLGAASGVLSFDGGTLQTPTANFTLSRAITLNPYGGTLDNFGSTSTATLPGIISGPGTLTKMGDGMLILSGANTYSGGTLLNGGILRVSDDSNLGAAGGPLSFNGGTLHAPSGLTTSRTLVVLDDGGTFDTGASDSVLHGFLFGYGTFTKLGTGQLTLEGDGSPFTGTYAVNQGAFTLNDALGSTLGPCNLVVSPASTFAGNGNLVGGLNLQGDGSGFSGSVEVPAAKTINLENTLGGTPSPCTVVVDPGGLMTGGGTLVGTLTNQGTISPGNAPGTLSVVGILTQTASATYRAEIASSSSYDKIAVTGTASLNGRLAPILLNGYRPQNGQVFPGVVTATRGISGAFSSVTNQVFGPTLFWQPLYHPNTVDLLVQRNYTGLPLAPLTGNQLAVGNMLNGLANTTTGDLNTVLTTLDSLPDSGSVRNAYQQISPDKAAALPNLAFAGANLQKRVLSQRITNLRFSGQEAAVLEGLPGSFNFNGSRAEGMMLAYNSASLSGLITGGKRSDPPAPESRWGLYLDPALILGSQQSSGNQTGFNFAIAGFNAGADYRVRDDLLVGLATGYTHTGATFRGSGGTVQASTWPLTAYAAYLPRPFYAYGSLGYALNLFNLERDLSFGGLNRTARSSTTGNQFNGYGEAGYDLKLKALVATPVLSLAYSRLWVNGFDESGAGALNLDVSSQNASSLQTGVGAKFAVPLKRNSVTVVPQVYASYQHEYSNSSRGLDARLSQAGSSFAFTTDSPHRNFAVVGADVSILTQKNLKVQLDYNAEVGRGNYTAHCVSAGLRWQF
jgi:outer membrane autotransporter protein